MQNEKWITTNITGSKQLIDWFGCWPSFHDAEVIEVNLTRKGTSWLKIHTWRMTSAVDPSGRYVLDKHVVVTFKLEDVQGLNLIGFNQQNVIFGLSIAPTESGIEIGLADCFGISGELVASQVAIEITPGNPKDQCSDG